MRYFWNFLLLLSKWLSSEQTVILANRKHHPEQIGEIKSKCKWRFSRGLNVCAIWETFIQLHFIISGMDDLGSEKSPCSSIGGGSRSDLVVSSSGASLTDLPGTPTSSASAKGSVHGGHQQRRSRAGRVRTVLTEKQLSLLKSCYSANPRPDALMKEQLVEMTGLSPRVVRVWFQNKRCKDKKKMTLNKSKVSQRLIFSQANLRTTPLLWEDE